MVIITETMPCSDATRPRMPEGASSERGFAYDSPIVATSGPSARCTAPRSIAAEGTGLPSSGQVGDSAAVAAGLPAFATKQDSTGVRGWSPPV